ncbi:hypothetical protein ACS0TY_029109 [Phlomoides rotata]
MRIHDQSRIKDPPPNYDPNGDQFSHILHVGGRLDKGTSYVGGSLRKFDYINAKLYSLSSIESFARNIGFGGSSTLYTCEDDGSFVPLYDDVTLKSLIKSSIVAGKELDIYIVIVEVGDENEGDTKGVEDEGRMSAVSSGSENSVEGENEEVEDEKTTEDEWVDIEESGEEDVNESDDDFNSAKASDSENGGDTYPIFNPKQLYDPHLKLKMIFNIK